MNKSPLIAKQPPVSDASNAVKAIARGVRARIEEETGYSRIVRENTVYIARAMQINESEIQEWLKREEQRLRDIKEQLKKLSDRRPDTTP